MIWKSATTTQNHTGGGIQFGPDGFLYIGMGDTGPQGDPQGHGQDLTLHLGKMLRIDVDHQDPGLAYAIPADNPFRDRADARPEIWAYGLREPWRFSFDPVTGDLWVGDVGQDRIEEVDHRPARRKLRVECLRRIRTFLESLSEGRRQLRSAGVCLPEKIRILV